MNKSVKNFFLKKHDFLYTFTEKMSYIIYIYIQCKHEIADSEKACDKMNSLEVLHFLQTGC